MLIVLAAIIIVQAAPKIFGPIGTWVDNFFSKMRRAQAQHLSEDWQALNVKVDHLEKLLNEALEKIDTMREYRAEHDQVLDKHREWDITAMRIARQYGYKLDPVPPLYPGEKHITEVLTTTSTTSTTIPQES